MTELEEAKPQTFGHMVGIYLTRQNQFVDDVDGLRQELVIGGIQFLTLVMIVGSKNIVVLFVQNVILLAQFLDALRKFGIDANLFLVAIAHEEPDCYSKNDSNNSSNNSPQFSLTLLMILNLKPVVTEFGIVFSQLIG